MLRSERGEHAERLVCRFLATQGLTLVQRNFRARVGEIDLVMQHQHTLVFVEVRFRHHRQYGGPVASVDATKQRKLIRTAQYYLQHHAPPDTHARIDVVGLSTSGPSDDQWYLPGCDAESSVHHVSGCHLVWIKNAIESGS